MYGSHRITVRGSLGSLMFVMVFTLPGCGSSEREQNGFRAERVGPGIISTDQAGEVFPAPSPDGGWLYFSKVKAGNWQDQTIVRSRRDGDGWLPPTTASFSGSEYSDRAPRFSQDGDQLFFTSNRPRPGTTFDEDDFNIWVVQRAAGGGWSEPRPLPSPVNTNSPEIHSSVTADGTLYFASARPGGSGRSDIYRATMRNGEYTEAMNLGPPINSEQSQTDLYVRPDGRLMILVITDHPDGFGGDDLYVSYLRDGRWSEPRNLGPAVNTPDYEYGPAVSADGADLYFTSHRGETGDIYRISLEALGIDGSGERGAGSGERAIGRGGDESGLPNRPRS
jgi:Tol biopolymer transport system component